MTPLALAPVICGAWSEASQVILATTGGATAATATASPCACADAPPKSEAANGSDATRRPQFEARGFTAGSIRGSPAALVRHPSRRSRGAVVGHSRRVFERGASGRPSGQSTRQGPGLGVWAQCFLNSASWPAWIVRTRKDSGVVVVRVLRIAHQLGRIVPHVEWATVCRSRRAIVQMTGTRTGVV